MQCGNDYCSCIQQKDLLQILRIILGLDRTDYFTAAAQGISYDTLLRLLRDHGEEIR